MSASRPRGVAAIRAATTITGELRPLETGETTMLAAGRRPSKDARAASPMPRGRATASTPLSSGRRRTWRPPTSRRRCRRSRKRKTWASRRTTRPPPARRTRRWPSSTPGRAPAGSATPSSAASRARAPTRTGRERGRSSWRPAKGAGGRERRPRTTTAAVRRRAAPLSFRRARGRARPERCARRGAAAAGANRTRARPRDATGVLIGPSKNDDGRPDARSLERCAPRAGRGAARRHAAAPRSLSLARCVCGRSRTKRGIFRDSRSRIGAPLASSRHVISTRRLHAGSDAMVRIGKSTSSSSPCKTGPPRRSSFRRPS